MPDPSGVLARIDSAIERWELGPDAARWTPTAKSTRMWIGDHEVPIAGATWTEIRMDTRPAPWPAAEAIRFEGQLLASALETFGLLGQFMAVIADACESIQTLSRALRLEPWPQDWNEPCSCHPKPFPAARDYRRRTKHRNRRR